MMETFFNVSEQTSLFLWSCVMGFGVGIFYDIFRVARIIFKHGKVSVFIEDVIFTLFFALCIFVYSTEVARGQIRFFIIGGAMLGFVVYLSTVGLLIVTIIRRLVFLIRRVLAFIYKHLFSPIISLIVAFCQILKSGFVYFSSTLKKLYQTSKNDLKQEQALVYNYHTQKEFKKIRGDIKNGSKKASVKKDK